MWLKKHMKVLIILFIVFVIGAGVVYLSKTIVKSTYSSIDILVQEEDVKNTPKESSKNTYSENSKVFVSDSSEETSDSDSDISMKKVSVLYDSNNVDIREQEYLVNKGYNYTDILDKIKEVAPNIFNEIEYTGNNVDYSNYVELERSDLNIFNNTFLQGNTFAYSQDSTEIISMFDNYYIVYKYLYNRDNSKSYFIVVDYSDALFNSNNKSLFDFGQSKNIMINPKYSKLLLEDEYCILFTKAF